MKQESPMKRNLPPGWATDLVHVLGSRSRTVDDNFNIGWRSQIRAVRLPLSDDWGVLVANELGDVRIYSGLPTEQPTDLPLRIVGDLGPDDKYRIGNSSTGRPDSFRYLAAMPHPDGQMWDLLVCNHASGRLEICRKLERSTALNLDWMRPEMDACGVPEVIDWKRDGVLDLLLGKDDGSLVRLPRKRQSDEVAFQVPGTPIIAGDAPIELKGPLFPNVVDWDCTGRSDLLIGTGDGYVMLFRDVGDESEVKFARGRRLVNADGFIKVEGPASPTIMQDEGRRILLVADGLGAVWHWPIEEVASYVTSDIFTAFGGAIAGIAKTYRKGSWWMRPDPEGALLAAGPEPPVKPSADPHDVPTQYDPPAPELHLKPPAQGTYEIHLTLRKPDDVPQTPLIRIRLSDERSTVVLKSGEFHLGPRQQIFFKAADLTGKDICIRQNIGRMTQEGAVPAYIESLRLVPVDRQPEAGATKKRTTVAAIFDVFDWYYVNRADTPEEMDELMSNHLHAGFDLVYYKLGGGNWEYASRIPEAKSVVPDLPTYTAAEKRFCERLIEMQESINRVELATAACKRLGMRYFGWIRVQNHAEHVSQGVFPLDRFFVEHPEFQEKQVDGLSGGVQAKLCLGYPEVRAFYIKIVEEAMDLGCDGIMVDTLRHLPKVMCGDPIAEEFHRRHGLDIRKLPPFDLRVIELQTEIFTEFLREVREAMLRKKPGAEMHVRVCKPYPLMGCDPGSWAREKIADAIIIENRAEPKAPDIAGLVAACRDTACAPGAAFQRTKWGGESMPLHPYRVEIEVEKYLSAGARSISFYGSADVIKHPELSRAVRRINHPEELPSRIFSCI